MTLDQQAQEWRGNIYALIGFAYYQRPSRTFLQGLAANDPFSLSVFPEIDDRVTEGLRLLSASLKPFRQGVPDDDLERVQWDYTRMFTGPGMPKAPPWESYYRTEERIVFSRYTLEVRACYERFGLVSEHKDHEPDDHIGLELEFMAHLCDRCMEALREGDRRAAVTTLDAQREFLDHHLLLWAPLFCRDVCNNAESDFFLGMARLTEGFLDGDREFLEAEG